MIDLYAAVKAVHVVSATILFGTGLGTAFHMWMAHRSRDLAAIAVVSRQVVQADLWFTTPAVVAQPATGVLLIWLSAADPFLPWLVLSYVLYAVAGLCWLPVLWLQVQARDLAGAAHAAGVALPARYEQLMRIWFWLGLPAFLSVLAILWLMTTKPAGLGERTTRVVALLDVRLRRGGRRCDSSKARPKRASTKWRTASSGSTRRCRRRKCRAGSVSTST